jgi:hypothetical protein
MIPSLAVSLSGLQAGNILRSRCALPLEVWPNFVPEIPSGWYLLYCASVLTCHQYPIGQGTKIGGWRKVIYGIPASEAASARSTARAS